MLNAKSVDKLPDLPVDGTYLTGLRGARFEGRTGFWQAADGIAARSLSALAFLLAPELQAGLPRTQGGSPMPIGIVQVWV